MTSIPHDAIVELFRSDGQLLKEMIGERYDLRGLEPRVLTPELTQLPSEYRADSVTVFLGADGEPAFAVVVEIQSSSDPRKSFTWPVYLCATRARHECPTLLVVLATNDKIAAEAEASIDLGHPGFQLKPIVITREQIPLVNDVESARRLPRLAILSALTHHALEVAAVALDVLKRSTSDYVEVYKDLILSALSEAEQKILEELMSQPYEWKSVQAKKQIADIRAQSKQEGLMEGRGIGLEEGWNLGVDQGRIIGIDQGMVIGIAQGKSLGLQEGKSLGLEEGKRQGRILAQQDMAIQLARCKLAELSPEQEQRIRSLVDEAQLQQLIITLGGAQSAAQAELALR